MTRNNKRLVAVAMVAGLGLAALPAAAGQFSFGLDLGRGGKDIGIGFSFGRPAAVAVPVPVQQVWVAPVYQTVTERVWVPTTQTQYRDVPVTDRWGRVISYRREAYTVQSGYWQEVQKQVLVSAGHYASAPVVAAPAPVVSYAGGRVAVASKDRDHRDRDRDRGRDRHDNRNNRGRIEARSFGR